MNYKKTRKGLDETHHCINLEKKWNFMVSLQNVQYDGNGRPTFDDVCAGSIISLNLVITAGHCAVYQPDIGFKIKYNDEKGLWDGLLVLSNSLYSKMEKSVGEKKHQVKEIILAPETEGKCLGLEINSLVLFKSLIEIILHTFIGTTCYLFINIGNSQKCARIKYLFTLISRTL